MVCFCLFRTAVYYATYFTQTTKKIDRPENGPVHVEKIFDYQTFVEAVNEFRRDPSESKTPQSEIHLFIGQKGTAAQFTRVLICAKVSSCKADTYLQKVLVS